MHTCIAVVHVKRGENQATSLRLRVFRGKNTLEIETFRTRNAPLTSTRIPIMVAEHGEIIKHLGAQFRGHNHGS
jgi:hypothetical protein